MMRRSGPLAGLMLFIAAVTSAQVSDWRVSVIGRALLTTSSRIYSNPDAPSFELRTRNTAFSSGYGGGAEIRVRRFDDNYFFYLAADYLSQSALQFKLDGSRTPAREVPLEEGYRLIPLELGAQVYVPIGSERWRLSMGGGVGAYLAERIYIFDGVRAEAVGTAVGYGIHVGMNVEYAVRPPISLVAGLKFRDPEVDVKNLMPSVGELKSRINVDGLTLHAGILVEIM